MSNTEESYVCCSMQNFHLCWEATLLASTSCWRSPQLPLWVLSAQLSIISSAPCEHSPSLWNGWWLCLDLANDLLDPVKTGEHTDITYVTMFHLFEQLCVSSRSTHGWLSLQPAVSASQQRERTGRALWRWAGRACCYPRETNHRLLHTHTEWHYSSSSRDSHREQSSNWVVLVN